MYRLIWVPITIGWVIVGLFLFIPYAWLAGGVYDTTLSAIMPLVAPAVIFVFALFIFAARNPWIVREEKRGFITAFWILLTIVNLPIVLRFTSIGLKALNCAVVADFIFRYRFYSFLVVTVIAILVAIVKMHRFFKKIS